VAREVVGVVSDVRQFGLPRAPFPGTYVPLAQIPDVQMALFNQRSAAATWIVRTAPLSGPSASALERELQGSTALPVAAVRTMDEVFDAATAPAAQNASLMAILGSASGSLALERTMRIALFVSLSGSGSRRRTALPIVSNKATRRSSGQVRLAVHQECRNRGDESEARWSSASRRRRLNSPT
jgi:hypothetical protein